MSTNDLDADEWIWKLSLRKVLKQTKWCECKIRPWMLIESAKHQEVTSLVLWAFRGKWTPFQRVHMTPMNRLSLSQANVIQMAYARVWRWVKWTNYVTEHESAARNGWRRSRPNTGSWVSFKSELSSLWKPKERQGHAAEESTHWTVLSRLFPIRLHPERMGQWTFP